jgi:rod shape determining protein RodA
VIKTNITSVFKSVWHCIKYSDKILWGIILSISIYSLLLVGSLSREGFNYFIVQAISVAIGLLGAVVLQVVNYNFISKASKWIAVACIILIVYTLFAGVTIEGSSGVNARAWIKLPGGITFQPSELVKIGFIITFARHLTILRKSERIKNLESVAILAVHAFVPVILMHLQGDDGAAIIFLCIALTMAFMANLPLRYFLSVGAIGALLAPIAWNFVLADYQKQRILTQMNPEGDPLNMGYQQIQGKLSIGSGGIFGTGLFNGPRVANNVVPIQESDFIFSVAGEELGFIGCTLIIVLLLLLILRIGFIARKSNNLNGALICFGFIGLITSQTFFNLGMCLSLLPVMGVTLPFFSVGGSSAACLYFGIGILQNIYLNRNQTKKTVDNDEP